MTIKHLLSLSDLKPEVLSHLVDRSVQLAAGQNNHRASLDGKVVGIYFRRPSTRTRTSFTVGALKLGAKTITYSPNDLQIVTGETFEDTAKVLAGYLDAFVIRTNDADSEMRTLAHQSEMAVINAMSQSEHPTQAIADLSTIKERFGRLSDIHLLYLGEGNNTAAALAWAVAHTPGMKVTFVTPKDYGLEESILERACKCASTRGAVIKYQHDAQNLPTDADAVYTSRWQTMGVPHADPHFREKFKPYSVTPSLMRRVSRSADTVFLHDLPAVWGEDVTAEVLNGPQSLAWRQARHKMFSAMAILEWCLGVA
ncbi:MAG TPA: ornithine carbamoyltransferase [Blastocatellia bacterium]|nr:ornithine carbamoyltransferase [Blastocatellia bacterium]